MPPRTCRQDLGRGGRDARRRWRVWRSVVKGGMLPDQPPLCGDMVTGRGKGRGGGGGKGGGAGGGGGRNRGGGRGRCGGRAAASEWWRPLLPCGGWVRTAHWSSPPRRAARARRRGGQQPRHRRVARQARLHVPHRGERLAGRRRLCATQVGHRARVAADAAVQASAATRCNPSCDYAPEAATPCFRGCNPVCPGTS